MAKFSGSMQAFFLAGALGVGAVGPTAAADLPLPPPPVIIPAGPPQFSGWYLRGDVGYGFDQLSNFNSNVAAITPGFQYTSVGLGNQMIIGGGFGYQINNWFRTDLTAEYQTPAKYWASESYAGGVGYGPGSNAYSASIRSTVVLANGYVDLGTWYGFTPFVGAGVGVAFQQFHGLQDVGAGPSNFGAFGAATDANSTQLAWALMAGVDYAIAPNWRLEVGYRYLDMGHLTSNSIICTPLCPPPYEVQRFNMAQQDVRVGLRYIFADVPVMPPAPPIVTKY